MKTTFARRSSEMAWFTIPTVGGMAGFLCWIALNEATARRDLSSVIAEPQFWMLTASAALLTACAMGALYGLLRPTRWEVRVGKDRVTFLSDGRTAEVLHVDRKDTKLWKLQNRRSTAVNAEPSLLYVDNADTAHPVTGEYRACFDDEEFLRAIRECWGEGYAPPGPNCTLRRKIRWWPPGLQPSDG